MNVIRANCAKCEKPIEFRSLQEFDSFNIGDPEIPSLLNLSLDGNIIICGCCKTYNAYRSDGKTSEVVILDREKIDAFRR